MTLSEFRTLTHEKRESLQPKKLEIVNKDQVYW